MPETTHNGTQEAEANANELEELRARNAQLEATVEALQGRELELSRELISYLKAERSQLRALVGEEG